MFSRARQYHARGGLYPGLRLSPEQFEIVSTAARGLPVEKRDAFLQRVAGLLRQRSGRPNDTDIATVAQLALATLVVSSA